MLHRLILVAALATTVSIMHVLASPTSLARLTAADASVSEAVLPTPFPDLAFEQVWSTVNWETRGADGPYSNRWSRTHVGEVTRRRCFIAYKPTRFLHFSYKEGSAEGSWREAQRSRFTWRLIWRTPAYDVAGEQWMIKALRLKKTHRDDWTSFRSVCGLPSGLERLFERHLPSS